MKINKRYAVGIPLAIVMTPAWAAGFVYQLLSLYFEAGKEMFDLAEKELEKWLDK